MDDGSHWILDGSYRLKMGSRRDDKRLLTFMQQAYRELSPHLKGEHLAQTVGQLWSDKTPVWFVSPAQPTSSEEIGCVWLGNAVDQVTGDRYTHIFLLYVAPKHRRRGLGRILMQCAEDWATQQGYPQMGLHVFTENNAAQSLYQKLGYCPQALVLKKSLQKF
jgi:ribosomal protein S18 acetylase RimI-like enzyme